MSTKDLSRTVIEGGRARRNVSDRRQSHREDRTHERAYLRELERDPDAADERSPRRPRKVYKWFHDKLGAAERWLLGHVGRPWRKVEGEILAAFDTRTLAGRHIVHDHLLPYRFGWRGRAKLTWRVHRQTFCVDDQGVLRIHTRRFMPVGQRPPAPRPEVIRELGERRLIVHGERLYWLEPTGRASAGAHAYRQTRELDADERAWWNTLRDPEREHATTPAPWDPSTRR